MKSVRMADRIFAFSLATALAAASMAQAQNCADGKTLAEGKLSGLLETGGGLIKVPFEATRIGAEEPPAAPEADAAPAAAEASRIDSSSASLSPGIIGEDSTLAARLDYLTALTPDRLFSRGIDALIRLAGLLTGGAGLLMVSNIRYHSFKQIDFKGKVPFFAIVVIMLVFAVVIVQPPLVLSLMFLAYAVSGPVLTLFHLRRHRSGRQQQTAPDDENP